jgi:phosphoglycolate phosphatase-like HAD superfamily hydrolase
VHGPGTGANSGVLLLFDIDGTLLRGATRAHRQALHAALSDVYGLTDPAAAHVDPAGRTDMEIARAILLDSGVSAERIDAGVEDLRAACVQTYARLCASSLAEFVIPGIPELLRELDGHPEARLSLVTGNLEPIARLKLSRSGLGGYFAPGQGAFGSDAEDRTELPAIARRRAGENGLPYPRERTVLIGDTARDVACAHADGLPCVAVGTGPHRRERLADADEFAPDPTRLRELLLARLGRAGSPD